MKQHTNRNKEVKVSDPYYYLHCLLDRESYYVDPIQHHSSAASHPNISATHNKVVYKASDVNKSKALGGCGNEDTSRMRKIQVSQVHY